MHLGNLIKRYPKDIIPVASIFVILLSLINLSFFSHQQQKQEIRSRAQEEIFQEGFDETTPNNLGLYQLKPNEIAVIRQDTGPHTGQMKTSSLLLKNGQELAFESDQTTSISLIQGNDKVFTYLQKDPRISIYNLDSRSMEETKEKIDTTTQKQTELSYILTIKDINPLDLRYASICVHNRKDRIYCDFHATSPAVFYLESPGTYDVFIEYAPRYNAERNVNIYHLFKEGILISQRKTTINVTRSEAKNLVKLTATDSEGIVRQPLQTKTSFLTYLPNPNLFSFFFMLWATTDASSNFFSNISKNYEYKVFHSWPSEQPDSKPHFFYGTFIGLQDENLNFTNNPSDFQQMDLRLDIDQQAGKIVPLVWTCNYPLCFATFNSAHTVRIPVSQTVYSLLPSVNFFLYSHNGSVESSLFSVEKQPRRWWSFSKTSFTQLPFLERKVYNGLGPTYWAAKFKNNQDSVNFYPYFFTEGEYTPLFAFLRQDYSFKKYSDIPFTIQKAPVQKDDPPITSGTIPGFSFSTWYVNPLIASVSLPEPGRYELSTEIPYKNKGVDLKGKIKADFDTFLLDPNPPAIKRLYYFANNLRSEIYDPNVANRLELEIDPIGGSLVQVVVSYSKDKNTFYSLPTILSDNTYFTDLPAITGISKLTLRIVASDNSKNTLSYTFELPAGTAPASP